MADGAKPMVDRSLDGRQAGTQSLRSHSVAAGAAATAGTGGPLDTIRITVNGTRREHRIEPRLLLIQYLRDVLDLTGTHVGCDSSQCGACTVLLDGDAVKSCTLFAIQADGCAIETIEGLGSDGSHSLQRAFLEKSAVQCGFCTPGMIMAAEALLRRTPDPAESEIERALEGNLCRCTGYRSIVAAVRRAAELRSAEDSP